MDLEGYDFLDFGASKGGSLRWAAGTFGGVGLGLERNPHKLEQVRAGGQAAILADATRLDLPARAVRYSVMLDFLEHLGGPAEARRALAGAARVSREFVYVEGPNFEAADYLAGHGLKRYYADWSGHRWHHGEAELRTMLTDLSLHGCVIGKDRIRDAADPNLVPLDAPRDGGRYDPALHAPKTAMRFNRRLFNRLVVLIPLGDEVDLLALFARACGFSYAAV